MANLLLIEDLPDNAALVQRVLQAQNHQIVWVQTAEEALQQAEINLPDLILLDLGLPDLDGQTLVGYLRRIPGLQRVPILVLTAWPEEIARQMVTAYGCDAYLSKPLDIRRLTQIIHTLLA